MYRTFLILSTFAITTSAWAVDAPPLPSTAKKLQGPEIEALYVGGHAVGTSFQDKKSLVTFDVKMDPKKKTILGNWALKGGKSGKVDMNYSIRGDNWCNKARKGGGKEVCVSVYTDGSDVYEVDDKGVVASKLTIAH
jgi:hypothetical protein